ncbi:MAG: hypothetical protein KAS30_05240, partial [Candidatus Diapherotrites archaeon]|nr:hypothetical protein [Candidatus Diapherotrites archaeon]
IKTKTIDKFGHPTKYRLKEYIKKAVDGESVTDSSPEPVHEFEVEGIRANFIIEGQSTSEALLIEKLEGLEKKINSDLEIVIEKCEIADVEETDGVYNAYMDIVFVAVSMRKVLTLLFATGPSVVEILHPQQINLNMGEAQDILMDVSEMVHSYTSYILKMKNQKEIDEFNKKLFKVD